jgi:fermentation-respiration switch protein FrsA (DUF1100 family)
MLLTLFGGYALVLTVLFVFQNRLLFFPSPTLEATPAAHGMVFEEATFETNDGERLHGWWVPAEKPRATLLFFHGNAGNISHRLDLVEIFRGLGLNVFLFDYRGYGRSTGKPSEDGLYRDAAAAWRYLTETRGLIPDEIVLFGRSLGGGPATWLATRERPRALILGSTFTSIPDVAAKQYPYLPVRLLTRNRFDNRARLAEVRTPVLVIHSRDDALIPFEHGRRLFETAPEPKAFLEIEGAHNNGYAVTGPRYAEGIDAFLTAHVGPKR